MAGLNLPYPKFIDWAVPGNRQCGVCPDDVPDADAGLLRSHDRELRKAERRAETRHRAAAEDRDHGHGRRGRRRPRRLDRRPRRSGRLPGADHLGARRRPAHRRHHLLRRALSGGPGRGRRRPAGAGADAAARRRRRGAGLGADGGGRAIQRGLVTPDRTTLVASTHRVYSIAEKSALGDGRVSSDALLAHAGDGGEALRPLRHGGGGRAERQRHRRGAVRRARRHRRAAVRAGRSSRRRSRAAASASPAA